jgi:hypothetical protein
MTKSNFEKLAQLPLFERPAHANEDGNPAADERSAKTSLFAGPPRGDDAVGPVTSYGAVRAADGRTARRTGRTVQFATVVSEETKRWLKMQAAARGKSMAALLDDMKAAYIEKFGE